MWVKALSKHKFGELKEPYINVDQITSIELGHGRNLNIKLSNGEEMVVSEVNAERLLQFVKEQSLSDLPMPTERDIEVPVPAVH